MTPWKYTDDSYRDYTRTAWNESAQKYTKLLRNLEPYGFDLIARVDPKVRERCLDIATGPGEPAMSLARMVGLDGKVTGIDLSEHMVELAAEAAKARRIPNAEFRVMDAERSEEHTSELQSPCNLVCRLLLEKKKPRSAHTRKPNTPPNTPTTRRRDRSRSIYLAAVVRPTPGRASNYETQARRRALSRPKPSW